jgi:hypothetical protein
MGSLPHDTENLVSTHIVSRLPAHFRLSSLSRRLSPGTSVNDARRDDALSTHSDGVG